MKGADFGDQRLNKRAAILLECLGSKPSLSIPAACKGLAETLAAYRFCDNDKVTWDKVLSPHRTCTIERIKQEEEVLCIQDTSELHFPGGASVVGLGPLNHAKQRGLHIHPTLAVTPERVPLGVLDAWMWAREDEGFGTAKAGQRRIEEKESIRWLEGYQRLNELAAEVGGTRLTYVADREADIYELFAEHHRQNLTGAPCADLLIRLAQEQRKLAGEGYLRETVEKQAALGAVEFDYPGSPKQPARRVCQSVRAAQVELQAPYRVHDKLPNVTVTVVLAREDNPPAGCEAIEWLLLSTRPAATLEAAAEVVRRYCCRWQIELFFKVLKSGCQVEKLQLEHIDRLEPALALYFIIAWRVLFLTFLGRVCPDLPCDVVFETQEWRAVYLVTQKILPPEQPPTLNEMVRMLAMLGGFLNRKGDGPPGSKAIWIGLQRMRDFVLALEAHEAAHQHGRHGSASG